MATTLVDWLVDYVSSRMADCYSRDAIVAKIGDGLDCGLCRETWIVEETDGTRSRQPVVNRVDFFDWWMSDGLFPISFEGQDNVWPHSILEDNVVKQLDYLSGRWGTHAGGVRRPDFYDGLNAVCDAHAVFRWSEMARSLGREDFVTWYKDWPLSSTLSATADTRRAVTADDLWPVPESVEPWTDMSLKEAVKRAFTMLFPGGLPTGTSKKRRNAAIGKLLTKHGVRIPDVRSFRRYLKEFTPPGR